MNKKIGERRELSHEEIVELFRGHAPDIVYPDGFNEDDFNNLPEKIEETISFFQEQQEIYNYLDFEQDEYSNKMDNIRLNKLMFFAQAWYLVRYNTPLFEGLFEQTSEGPVHHQVYNVLKPYGNNDIDVGFPYEPSVYSDNEITTLGDVMEYYGKLDTPRLIELSNEEGMPWYGSNGAVISNDEIKEYFKEKPHLPGDVAFRNYFQIYS